VHANKRHEILGCKQLRMDYIKTYKSFINSHYVSEGIRITVGVLIPALLMSFFDMLQMGIMLSLGALFVSITDSPGPIHHRKNGMLTCVAAIFIVAVITGLVAFSPVLLGVFIAIACFFFSMINIYGGRAGSVGIAALIVLTLNIAHVTKTPQQVLEEAVLMSLGGFWYTGFSLLLYNFRPYRLAQQALGDCIQATADYLRIRAELYNKEVNYDSTYKRLLQQQAVVQQKQTMISELLFKTRSIVKESTNMGRGLVMIYLDVTDMFERIMMSHQRYSQLHKYFDETDILEDYRTLALELADELDEVGIAVKSGTRSSPNRNILDHINQTKEKREQLRQTYLKADNVEGFISLRSIIENIQDLAERLQTLHTYTKYDRSLRKKELKEAEYENLISSQPITPSMFLDNLTFKSDIFRHSLRLSIAVIVGYLVSNFFKLGHSYWILLTIIVIVKPAYSLSKSRNRDRLIGTVLGVLIGLLMLIITQNNIALLCLMILFMALGYSFMRVNYFMSVLLMTPYLILFYHFLYPHELRTLLEDRIVDTAIGSAIAFPASLFLIPTWERGKIKALMIEMLEQSKNYFSLIAGSFNGDAIKKHQQQAARKDALVALANLSDAFNRMSSEPKNQQKGAEAVHQFVVLNHMLTSYTATLGQHLLQEKASDREAEFRPVIEDIAKYFSKAICLLKKQDASAEIVESREALRTLNGKVNALLQKRKEEIDRGQLETPTKKALFELKSITDQFNLIYNVVVDLAKLSQTINVDD
jgi:uncharacterized membrane protein (TIGR01666 family)